MNIMALLGLRELFKTERKRESVRDRWREEEKAGRLTLSGSISAMITNGIGSAPHAATNMHAENAETGINLYALTSTEVEVLRNI